MLVVAPLTPGTSQVHVGFYDITGASDRDASHVHSLLSQVHGSEVPQALAEQPYHFPEDGRESETKGTQGH